MTNRTAAAAGLVGILSGAAAASPAPPRPEHEVTEQDVVYQVPGMDRVTVRKDIPYQKTEQGELKLDLYDPPEFGAGTRVPAVVFINGVGGRPDDKLKEWGIYRSWGRLVAASGWIGVTFEARSGFDESRQDIRALFAFLRTQGAVLGIDANRIAAWVCSANVTSGLPFLMEDADPGVRGAVVYYGTAQPKALRRDLPVFYVRAGRDNETLNAGIDMLFARAIESGAPWILVNAPESHHAFDALDETTESRRIIRETLEFYAEVLAPPAAAAPPSPARKALGHWFAREYPEASAAYGEYVRSHPDDATAYLRLGLCQAHIGKPAEAAGSLEKAVSLGATSPVDLYNVACGYALLGKPDEALDFLERAAAAGFSNRRLLETDEDLASLRGRARFQKLLEQSK